MTKVVESKDCRNSPKNLLVQSLAVAIEQGDATAFARCVADGVSWAYPGRAAIVGKDAAAQLLASVRSKVPRRIEVEHAISHGKAGAANGTVQLHAGELLRFCHMIEFTNTKGDCIATITSYYAPDALLVAPLR